MKKLFSALLSMVCLTVFLALPASASTDTADSVSAAFETAVCDACGEKAVVYWSQTQTPWHIEEYVRCIHDCPWYNDAVQSCFVIDTYVCNSCSHSYTVETPHTLTAHPGTDYSGLYAPVIRRTRGLSSYRRALRSV